MSFEGITDYLNIDCDRMDVYRLPSENRNSLMTGDFPVLSSGDNIVSYSGGITSVTITPKFWTI
jgi:phage-related protein